MTINQRFMIERKQGMQIALEGIRQCQWRLVRCKSSDPFDCSTCEYFLRKECKFRSFLAYRGDKKAWTPFREKA